MCNYEARFPRRCPDKPDSTHQTQMRRFLTNYSCILNSGSRFSPDVLPPLLPWHSDRLRQVPLSPLVPVHSELGKLTTWNKLKHTTLPYLHHMSSECNDYLKNLSVLVPFWIIKLLASDKESLLKIFKIQII